MDFNERIKRIKKYFLTFNIADGAAYTVVRYPTEKWKVPDANILKEKFKTIVRFRDGNWFYMTEIENGTDCVFDAIEYTIAFNKEAMERATMLRSKMEELKVLFTSEPIEKLKTLEFTFVKPKKNKAKKDEPKVEETVKTTTETPKDNEEVTEVAPVVEETPKVEEDVKDSSLLSFAKSIAAE